MGTIKSNIGVALALGVAVLPTVVSAQEWVQYIGGTLTLLDTYVVWSTLVLALVAIGMVFMNAKKMKGGVFGTVLNLFGFGMAVSFLGFLSMQFPNILGGFAADFLPDTFFILGYVLMAIAASRLARVMA